MGEVTLYGSVFTSHVHACLPCLIPEYRLLLLSHSPMHQLPEQQCTGDAQVTGEQKQRQPLKGEGCWRGSAGDGAEEVLQTAGRSRI